MGVSALKSGGGGGGGLLPPSLSPPMIMINFGRFTFNLIICIQKLYIQGQFF